jgi:hypothetical protein
VRLEAEIEDLKASAGWARHMSSCGSGRRALRGAWAYEERSYRRWQQRERHGRPVKGPWPTPSADRVEPVAIDYADTYPQRVAETIATLMPSATVSCSTGCDPETLPLS